MVRKYLNNSATLLRVRSNAALGDSFPLSSIIGFVVFFCLIVRFNDGGFRFSHKWFFGFESRFSKICLLWRGQTVSVKNRFGRAAAILLISSHLFRGPQTWQADFLQGLKNRCFLRSSNSQAVEIVASGQTVENRVFGGFSMWKFPYPQSILYSGALHRSSEDRTAWFWLSEKRVPAPGLPASAGRLYLCR